MTYQHLERISCKDAGVPAEFIYRFLQECENNNIELHSVMMARHGKVFFEAFARPYGPEIPHYVHSMTKAFTNTAAGLAYTQGLLNLDDKVISFYPEHAPKEPTEYQKEMTVKDLITMRSGMDKDINGSEFRTIKTSWIARYFQQPVPYKPGTHFFYCSGNTFMTSAIVQKVTGMTAHDVINKYIVPELGMRPFTWTKSPEGICSGNSGISLCVEDIVKFGQLYLNHGEWNGKQIIAREWADRSLGLYDPVQRKEGDPLYNYHWMQYKSEDIYSAEGFLGQFCSLVPKLDMVIAITSATGAKAEIGADAILRDCIVEPMLKGAQESGDWEDMLERKRQYMNLMPRMLKIEDEPELNEARTYSAEENEDQISRIILKFDHDSVLFGMEDHRGLNWVDAGLREFKEGYTGITTNYLHHEMQSDHDHVFACAWWETQNVLKMEWRFAETAFCDFVTVTFEGDTIRFNRRVNVNSKALERPTVTAHLADNR
ncbi:MAG: serine hydrolase [Solobacterium sp.]|nr:serine hydrolase [Solobacterium sp.]